MIRSQVELQLREFEHGDEAAFRALNVAWIQRYFTLEPQDFKALDDPKAYILDKGGRIFFAVAAGAGQPGGILGCCALIFMSPGEYELAKMTVAESAQGAGVGGFMLRAVIEAARHSGVRRLYLETNHTLTPAVRLYRSAGFRELPPEQIKPSPYARADVYMELFL